MEIETLEVTLNGNPQILKIYYLDVTTDRGYRFVLSAHTPDLSGNHVGKTMICGAPRPICTANPEYMEGGDIKVNKPYFGSGIAKILIGLSKDMIHGLGKKLVIRPFRTEEIGGVPTSWDEYPISTVDLRAMYKRNGFREFTPGEIDDLAIRMKITDIKSHERSLDFYVTQAKEYLIEES